MIKNKKSQSQRFVGYFLSLQMGKDEKVHSKLRSIKPIWGNKKGISLMLSYVLLVFIALTMAAVIYASLKLMANVEKVESCEEGTFITIEDYSCENINNNHVFRLTLRNSGRFNIDGFIISVGDDPKEIPVHPLYRNGIAYENLEPGYYYFDAPLEPASSAVITEFSNKSVPFTFIKNVRIQPFIKKRIGDFPVVCEDAIIRQEIESCQINE